MFTVISGHLLEGGDLTPLQRCSRRILQSQDNIHVSFTVKRQRQRTETKEFKHGLLDHHITLHEAHNEQAHIPRDTNTPCVYIMYVLKVSVCVNKVVFPSVYSVLK